MIWTKKWLSNGKFPWMESFCNGTSRFRLLEADELNEKRRLIISKSSHSLSNSFYASEVRLRSGCVLLPSERPSITKIHFFCTRYARLSTCIWPLIEKSIMSAALFTLRWMVMRRAKTSKEFKRLKRSLSPRNLIGIWTLGSNLELRRWNSNTEQLNRARSLFEADLGERKSTEYFRQFPPSDSLANALY